MSFSKKQNSGFVRTCDEHVPGRDWSGQLHCKLLGNWKSSPEGWSAPLTTPTGPLKVWPSNPGKLGLKPLISPTGPLKVWSSNCLDCLNASVFS